jgi:multiple sugar transport system substrate-binding protein
MNSSPPLFNKSFIKKLYFLVVVLMVSSAIVSCGGIGSIQNDDTTAAPQAVDLSGKKLAMLAITPHIGTAQALSNWFKEETGAVVQVVEVGYGDLPARTLDDKASSTPQYDVFEVWYPTLGTMVEAGVLLDLTDFISQNAAVIQPDDFIRSFYDPYTLYNGKRWAIPFDGDTHVLFYSKSLQEKYNL